MHMIELFHGMKHILTLWQQRKIPYQNVLLDTATKRGKYGTTAYCLQYRGDNT